MHELGHNLGLAHGGDVGTNHKPNYYSIMNYQYQLNGLPVIGNAKEGDRYYGEKYRDNWSEPFKKYFPNNSRSDIHRGPMAADMKIDFSDGTGQAIDETNVSETAGLGRGGSAGIDFNGDNDTTDTLTDYDLNDDQVIETLTDYNDWANINLIFMRTYNGDTSGAAQYSTTNSKKILDPIADDYQEAVIETLEPPHLH